VPPEESEGSTSDLRGLLVDVDGAVLLYASSQWAERHRVARIAAGGGELQDRHLGHRPHRSAEERSHREFDVRITPLLSCALALEPIVDLRGYRFIFEPRTDAHGKHEAGSGHDEHEHEDHHAGDDHDERYDAAGLRVRSLPFHPEDVDALDALLE
jgi:hypothetical protein